MLEGDQIGWLTKNDEFGGTGAIDPDLLFAVYGCLY